ncbi:beta/alpha barrel domain-containing protein [Paucidesulfovibrio longus]|uniref:4-hydroxy-2-ketovalerate aldolase n=1 Tax=Paucidesulfovibrio longus TaxID=889 RepID=UPI0003B45D35|nr:4-hydroxy-2-ketovalerate aldolase [Paucidesulfovibrio longus]
MTALEPRRIEILECTLRDGSYAVDFQFTSRDTAIIARGLERAGIRRIEIGHGLGLNASNTGAGTAAENDEAYMRAVEGVLAEASWGMFCIPGIARPDDLRLAGDHGMGFVRIGVQPENFEQAAPFARAARDRGMRVFVNLMKSYTVDPDEFGAIAARVAGFGADGLYLVDSAGCMLPNEVRAYLEAAAPAGLELGFHGHDNLRLGMANALAAAEHGARWIDTTLQGIGRSSGNPSTEAFAALLLRRGAFREEDFFALLRLGERHIRPLLRSAGQGGMEVVSGLAGFHSGFLDRVAAIAREERAPLAGVVLRLCEQTRSGAPEELVREIARALHRERLAAPETEAKETAATKRPAPAPDAPRTPQDELDDVLRRVTVQARKLGLHSLLNVVADPLLTEGRRVSHVVHVFPDAVFGSVEVGDADAARELLRATAGKVDFHLLDASPLPGGAPLTDLAREALSPFEILEYDDAEVLLRAVTGQLQGILCGLHGKRVLLFGGPPAGASLAEKLAQRLERLHARVTRIAPPEPGRAPDGDMLERFAGAAAQCDVLAVCSPGFAPLAEAFLAASERAVVFEARIGSLGPENIRALRGQGFTVYRPDMRSVMASELRMLLAYRLHHHQGFPEREIGGVRLVSHGLIGRPGDVVVDDVLRPTHIIGVSDGAGLTRPAKPDDERLRRLEDLLQEGRDDVS